VALKIGDQAPDFEVSAQQAGESRSVRLRDYQGQKNVVLYFYPKDFTPVCTQEACGFRDMYAELASQDTEVIGVSVDDDASHLRFASKHRVPFPLVADPDKTLARKYGATSLLRDLLGGTSRITYVIDKQGKIAAIFDSPLRAQQHLHGVQSTITTLR
jgi:peroxiredoxin Q/BCP